MVTPNGGEFWLLSEPSATRTELISWTMSDDVPYPLGPGPGQHARLYDN